MLGQPYIIKNRHMCVHRVSTSVTYSNTGSKRLHSSNTFRTVCTITVLNKNVKHAPEKGAELSSVMQRKQLSLSKEIAGITEPILQFTTNKLHQTT